MKDKSPFYAHPACIGIVASVLFLFLWEVLCQSREGWHFILPPPSKVAFALWENAGRFYLHTLATFKEMVGGFFLALFIAFPLAWAMEFFSPLRAILQPVFVAIQCVPIFTLAPLMILWFGWSFAAIIIPTALMIFFPLTMSIYQGLCATPKHLLDFFKLHQATSWQILYKLQLPWALPHLFSGFRISIALAGIGAVAGEWAGAQEGLGLLMLESRRAADIETMFGALTCVTAVSLALYGGAVFLENRIIKRRQASESFQGRAALVLMVAAIFCGCQQSKEDLKETVLILDWLPNPNHVPIYVGIERGFFQDHGINLKVLKVADPSDSIPYLTSGQVDLCLTYMSHTIKALDQGAAVIPVGILIQQPLNAVIFRTDEGINQPADLTGKVIGYCVDGYHMAFLQAMFRDQNISPKEWRNVSFDLVSTLGTHQVDALYGAYWNIEGENLRAWGVETSYFPLSDFDVPGYYELIFLARKESHQAKEEFISSFQQALQKSIDYALASPDSAFEDYLKFNPDKSQKTRQWEKNAWLKTLSALASNQQIDRDLWNGFVDWLVEQKMLKTVPYDPKM